MCLPYLNFFRPATRNTHYFIWPYLEQIFIKSLTVSSLFGTQQTFIFTASYCSDIDAILGQLEEDYNAVIASDESKSRENVGKAELGSKLFAKIISR